MLEAGTIIGTIESNNGTEALVSFAAGAKQLFKRSTGSGAEFSAAFPVGGTAQAKPFVGNFPTYRNCEPNYRANCSPFERQ